MNLDILLMEGHCLNSTLVESQHGGLESAMIVTISVSSSLLHTIGINNGEHIKQTINYMESNI